MTNLDPVPSSRAMWRAYALAPAITPFAFVALVTPMGIRLPTVAFLIAMMICYLVAGLIGMPIAFFLRGRNALNAYTIHGAAAGWGLITAFFCSASSIYVAAAIGGTWESIPLVVGYFCVVIVPPVVLAGTAFWLLLRKPTSGELGECSQDLGSLAS